LQLFNVTKSDRQTERQTDRQRRVAIARFEVPASRGKMLHFIMSWIRI